MDPVNDQQQSVPAQPSISSMPPGMEERGGGNDMLFRFVIVLAVIAVIALVGSAVYYLYTKQQLKNNPPTASLPSNVSQTATAIPQQVPSEVSSSDKSSLIEQELNQTSVEDFASDFAQLSADSAGL